jgi:CDP-diacylglycerol pyrophosphatase
MTENENTEDLPRRRFLKLSGAAGAAAILAGAGHNLAAAQTPGPTPSPECGYLNDTDRLWKAVVHCNGTGAGCTAIEKNPNDNYYVFPGSEFWKPNFITVPRVRVRGIECPWITESNRPNYWQDAWDRARTSKTKVDAEVGLGVNAKKPRSADQLHIHMARVRSYSLKDIHDKDSDVATTFKDWHDPKHHVSITGWNSINKYRSKHVYRVVRVNSFSSDNLFQHLRAMVGQKEMENQTLIVIPRRAGGYYIVNSQASLTGLGLMGSDTCDPLLRIQDGN